MKQFIVCPLHCCLAATEIASGLQKLLQLLPKVSFSYERSIPTWNKAIVDIREQTDKHTYRHTDIEDTVVAVRGSWHPLGKEVISSEKKAI